MSQHVTKSTFIKAIRLLFPTLEITDKKFIELLNFAKEKYYEDGNRICVLCAIPNSRFDSFREFAELCQKLNLDPGLQEVVISSGYISYTPDYGLPPQRL